MPAPTPFKVSDHYAYLFWLKVLPTETCWLWCASLDTYGYGQFNIRDGGKRRMVKAHNVAWIIVKGKFPPGLEPDHTCLNKACVNPSHLEWVTGEVNKERNGTRSKTCRKGHKWDEQDPILEVDNKSGLVNRRCRVCHNIRQKESYERNR